MNATQELDDDRAGSPEPAAAHTAPAPRAAALRPALPLGTRDPREKSVPLACVLSLMPGLGQVYVGYYQRGFVHALVVGSIIAFLANGALDEIVPLFGIFLPFFWLYNVIDAGRRASLYNQVLAGSETIELPRDFEMPQRGSVWGGLVLMAIGAILLSRTRFGYSLDWLEEWWPAAPILFGGWLVGRAIQDRMAGGAAPRAGRR
jgi:hypothetical protein